MREEKEFRESEERKYMKSSNSLSRGSQRILREAKKSNSADKLAEQLSHQRSFNRYVQPLEDDRNFNKSGDVSRSDIRRESANRLSFDPSNPNIRRYGGSSVRQLDNRSTSRRDSPAASEMGMALRSTKQPKEVTLKLQTMKPPSQYNSVKASPSQRGPHGYEEEAKEWLRTKQLLQETKSGRVTSTRSGSIPFRDRNVPSSIRVPSESSMISSGHEGTADQNFHGTDVIKNMTMNLGKLQPELLQDTKLPRERQTSGNLMGKPPVAIGANPKSTRREPVPLSNRDMNAGPVMINGSEGFQNKLSNMLHLRLANDLQAQQARGGTPLRNHNKTLLEMSVVERNSIWKQARDSKIRSALKQKENSALVGCTFKPDVARKGSASQLAATSRVGTPSQRSPLRSRDSSIRDPNRGNGYDSQRNTYAPALAQDEQGMSYSKLHEMKRNSLGPNQMKRTSLNNRTMSPGTAMGTSSELMRGRNSRGDMYNDSARSTILQVNHDFIRVANVLQGQDTRGLGGYQ